MSSSSPGISSSSGRISSSSGEDLVILRRGSRHPPGGSRHPPERISSSSGRISPSSEGSRHPPGGSRHPPGASRHPPGGSRHPPGGSRHPPRGISPSSGEDLAILRGDVKNACDGLHIVPATRCLRALDTHTAHPRRSRVAARIQAVTARRSSVERGAQPRAGTAAALSNVRHTCVRPRRGVARLKHTRVEPTTRCLRALVTHAAHPRRIRVKRGIHAVTP
jgi:hypothetical protein